jgi:uncharacterized protein (TIGR00730 family)
MTISSMVVFCGSKTGNDLLFIEHARQLGYLLADENIRLIYGGGRKGLMGIIADAVLEKNGEVTGIIPHLLTVSEQQHLGITELIIADDMHSRKKMLYEKCDAAVIMPGGIGTLDEFFELLTWNQLSIHNKKVFLLNSNGFYDSLLQHINKMHAEGFLYKATEEQIIALSSVEELKAILL